MKSINERSAYIARVAFMLIRKRWRGCYVFLTESLAQPIVIENKAENIEKIKQRKRKNIIVGYYVRDSSFKYLKRDVKNILQSEFCKAVEEPEIEIY